MSSQSHNTSLLDLEPDTLIELYEIDLGEQDGLYRFHPGKNNLKDIMLSDLQGELQTYYPMPIETKWMGNERGRIIAEAKVINGQPSRSYH